MMRNPVDEDNRRNINMTNTKVSIFTRMTVSCAEQVQMSRAEALEGSAPSGEAL